MVEALRTERPGLTLSYEAFTRGCFHKTFVGMCREDLHYTDAELDTHYRFWKSYVRTHIPPAYPGMRELLLRYRANGGVICVSSHSGTENITRDYTLHFGFLPDQIFSADLPAHLSKPSPYALEQIMQRYTLRPDELLMVDDMKPGYDMAKACGVPFACAGWSHDMDYIADYMRKYSDFYLTQVDSLVGLLFTS